MEVKGGETVEDRQVEQCRREIRERLMHIATGSANDAVKLAYLQLESGDWHELEGLNLSALTEFKRNSAGAVEIKLVDRVSILERLMDGLGGDASAAAAFLKAMEGAEEGAV